MEQTMKKPFEAPATEVFMVSHEGVICSSPANGDFTMDSGTSPAFKGFSDEEEW